MKFAYIQIAGVGLDEGEIPGRKIAELLCKSLNGQGPYERGDYGWEWVFKGQNYKAIAVLQQYEDGWLIPVNVSFLDRVFKRGSTVLDDLVAGVEKGLGGSVKKLMKFNSEQEFRDSGI